MSEEKYPHITRCASPNRAPGWQVSVKRNRKAHGRFFADAKRGGKEGSLKAAIAYRDHLLSILPPAVRIFTSHKANKTGKVGVLFAHEKSRANRKNPYYIAVWHEKGKRCVRKFSITKYGKEKAFQKAVEARENALNGLLNVNAPPHKIDCFHLSSLMLGMPFLANRKLNGIQ